MPVVTRAKAQWNLQNPRPQPEMSEMVTQVREMDYRLSAATEGMLDRLKEHDAQVRIALHLCNHIS